MSISKLMRALQLSSLGPAVMFVHPIFRAACSADLHDSVDKVTKANMTFSMSYACWEEIWCLCFSIRLPVCQRAGAPLCLCFELCYAVDWKSWTRLVRGVAL
jgi:hypothetical protein